MEFDLETLLAPVSDDNPAGPDLDYDDAEREEIRMAFDSSVSVDSTGAADAPSEVDWPAIIRKIVSQSRRTKDIWLAVYLARAGARRGDLGAVTAGAQMLEGLLDRYWDVVHPSLEELGVIGRKTPCDSLANRGQFLRYLETMPLIQHQRLGSYSAADLDRFRQEGDAADGYGFFRAAMEDLGDSAVLAALDQVRGIEAALRRADRLFTDKAAGESSPNFEAAYDTLRSMERSLAAFVVAPIADAAEAPGTDGQEAPASGAPPASGAVGAIRTREDVTRALDAICDYYRREEPASPVPFALRRARAWVGLDFMGILNDLAPDSLNEVNRILQSRESSS